MTMSNSTREVVTVQGGPEHREYGAALELKAKIEASLRPGEDGQIIIRPSVKFYGQKRETDLLLFASFPQGLRRTFKKAGRSVELEFRNLFSTIEVKDHVEDDIHIDGFAAWVRYRDKWSDATDQSDEQKTSAFLYLQNRLGWSPFVSNLIWFRNASRSYLGADSRNLLSSDFSFEELLLRVYEGNPQYGETPPPGRSRYYCMSVEKADDERLRGRQLFDLYTEHKRSAGVLTSQKLHRIVEPLLSNQKYAESIGNRLVLLRGRAGTGKTLKLLHIARDLCVNRNQRVLILTYNRMLVSDLQRMITLAGISSDLDSATVAIDTVHAYIKQLLVHFGIEFEDKEFIERYDELKSFLLEYLISGLIVESDLDDFRRQNLKILGWDTILIDEGQDWPEDEKSILFRLFDSKNFVVATGTGQLIRRSESIDWTAGLEVNRPPGEKRSLRQKQNLGRFIESFANEIDARWDLEPSDKLLGGRVIVVIGKYTKALHDRLVASSTAAKTIAYDHMFLAPPLLTKTEQMRNGRTTKVFALRDSFNSMGIRVWDGINTWDRTEYPTDVREHRVVTYESARGLEAWVVVCLAFDSFYDYKLRHPYIVNQAPESEGTQLALGLPDSEERVRALVNDWLLIALTRAVDTTVITLENRNSAAAKMVLQVAEQMKDFVEVIEA